MAKQEIDQVEIIANDDFSVPGGVVRKGELCRCTRRTAKQLVATGQAHYPTDDEREAQAEKTGDVDPEGDPEKLEAARTATQATATEEDSEKAEAAKATKASK